MVSVADWGSKVIVRILELWGHELLGKASGRAQDVHECFVISAGAL